MAHVRLPHHGYPRVRAFADCATDLDHLLEVPIVGFSLKFASRKRLGCVEVTNKQTLLRAGRIQVGEIVTGGIGRKA